MLLYTHLPFMQLHTVLLPIWQLCSVLLFMQLHTELPPRTQLRTDLRLPGAWSNKLASPRGGWLDISGIQF